MKLGNFGCDQWFSFWELLLNKYSNPVYLWDQDHNEEIEKENAERNFWKNHKEQLQEISNNIHETEIEELKSQPTLDKVVDLIAKFNKEIGEFVENTKDTDAGGLFS